MAEAETTSIQLKNVYEGGKTYLFEQLPLSMTIAEFKVQVCEQLEEKPLPANQRIIHRGKICTDGSTLVSIFGNGEPPHSLHLVLSGRTTSLARTLSEPVKSVPKHSETMIETQQPREPSPNRALAATHPSPTLTRSQARAAAAAAAEARASLSPQTKDPLEVTQTPEAPTPPESLRTSSAPASSVSRRVSFSNDSGNTASSSSLSSEGVRGGGSEGVSGGGSEGSSDGVLNGRREGDTKAYQEAYTKAVSSSSAAKAVHEAWCEEVKKWKDQEALATRVSQILYQRQVSEHWAARNYSDRGYATSISEAMSAHAGMSNSWMHMDPLAQPQTRPVPPLRQGLRVQGVHAVTLDQLIEVYRQQVLSNRRQTPQQQPDVAQEEPGLRVNAGLMADDGAAHQAVRVRRLHFVFFLGADDLKLALKLIVVVGLFGQGRDRKSLMLMGGIALGFFIFQVYNNNRNRRRQMEEAGNQGGNQGPADRAPNIPEGDHADDNVELPPLEMRGLLQGGIAPGGGYLLDFAYFVISFLLSMHPGWQPLPVCDPLQIERRRALELRRAQARGEVPMEEGNDQNADNQVNFDGHLHQD